MPSKGVVPCVYGVELDRQNDFGLLRQFGTTQTKTTTRHGWVVVRLVHTSYAYVDKQSFQENSSISNQKDDG